MRTICTLLLAFLFLAKAEPQTPDTLRLTLPQVIALAQSESPGALLARTRLEQSYWQYQVALSKLKPTIGLNMTLPDLSRNIEAITLPSGADAFVRRAQMRNSASFGIWQPLTLTGGQVFLGTDLSRIDLFRTATQDPATSYFLSPLSLTIVQPLFQPNDLRWTQKLAPLEYEEATRAFAEEKEDQAWQAAVRFFDVFLAQLDLEAALRDKANADTLLSVSRGRFEVGRIAETELLQIELSAMNASAAVANARVNLQAAMERLRNFLGLKEAAYFVLEPPVELPEVDIPLDKALELARTQRSEHISFQRRLLEAERNVAIAKANTGIQANLIGGVSLSKIGATPAEALDQPDLNMFVRTTLEIPILDWGRRKANYESALASWELEQMQVEQERISFEEELRTRVQQFDLVRQRVQLAARAFEVARKREALTRSRYYIGKVGITELGIAISERESARRAWMDALRNFWLAWYELRRLTLYDFERQVSLVQRAAE